MKQVKNTYELQKYKTKQYITRLCLIQGVGETFLFPIVTGLAFGALPDSVELFLGALFLRCKASGA
jgi:hypothetical protein